MIGPALFEHAMPGWPAAHARRRMAAPLVWLVLFMACGGIGTVQAAPNTLQAVDVVTAGEDLAIRLRLAHSPPTPSVFTVDDPARISVDLPDTQLGDVPRYQTIERGPIEAVASAAGDNRARVIIKLAHPVDYKLDRQANQITIGLADRGPARRAANTATAQTRTATARRSPPTRPAGGGARVANIDFRRGEGGAGRVIIALDGQARPIDVSQQNGRIVARLPGVSLPDALRKRYEVLDFATPVEHIEARARGGDTRITITPVAGADYERVAYQTGDRFIIELQPATAQGSAPETSNQPRYTGEKISLSFQNIAVRAVLQIIADVADVNMVVSDSVSGNIALRLEDVPWDQALDIILRAKNLGMRRRNNVISVAPLAEIAAREQAEQQARQATRNLAPLHSEIIQINYAKAADIAALLRSNQGDRNELSLLSARGQVTVDQRTNSLLVNDTREKLDNIRDLITRLDIPVRQVLIQARIVVANRNFSRNLGVSQQVNDTGAFESPDGGNYIANSGFSVTLPTANPAGTVTTSIVGDTFNLDLALSALESENRGEIISSPRVITGNAKEAQIEQGVEIPYLEAASSGAATVEFKEAVLNLTVTPHITPDQRVIMDLFVTQDTQGDTVSVQGGGAVPSINTRSITTQVLVNDGETVVLGGIYEQENRDQVSRVPILGDLPLIGPLFRNTQKQRDKRELLLFITPKILRDTLSAKRSQ